MDSGLTAERIFEVKTGRPVEDFTGWERLLWLDECQIEPLYRAKMRHDPTEKVAWMAHQIDWLQERIYEDTYADGYTKARFFKADRLIRLNLGLPQRPRRRNMGESAHT